MWNDTTRGRLNQSLPTTTSATVSSALAQSHKVTFSAPNSVSLASSSSAAAGLLNHGRKDDTACCSLESSSTTTTRTSRNGVYHREVPTTVAPPPVWMHDSSSGHSWDSFMDEVVDGSDHDEHVFELAVPKTASQQQQQHGLSSLELLEPFSWSIHLPENNTSRRADASSTDDLIRFMRNSEPNSAIYLARDEIVDAIEAICQAYPLVATFFIHTTPAAAGNGRPSSPLHLTDPNEIRAWLQQFNGPRSTALLLRRPLETLWDEDSMLDDSNHVENRVFECPPRRNSTSKLGHHSQLSLSLSDILESSNKDACVVGCELFPTATHRQPSFWCCGHTSNQSTSSSSSSWSSNRMRTSAIHVPSDGNWQESSWSSDDWMATLTPCNPRSDNFLSISSMDVVMGESNSSLE